jgi:hypothetical protein
VLRLIVPHLGFTEKPVPDKIPEDLEKVIEKLNKESKTNREFLTKAYGHITDRFHGARLKTITKWWYSFRDVFSYNSGYVPCNLHNYLLRIMLIKSKRFSEKDIKIKTVFFNFFIHQYLQVKVDSKWINVDPNSKYWGVPFGKRAILFG